MILEVRFAVCQPTPQGVELRVFFLSDGRPSSHQPFTKRLNLSEQRKPVSPFWCQSKADSHLPPSLPNQHRQEVWLMTIIWSWHPMMHTKVYSQMEIPWMYCGFFAGENSCVVYQSCHSVDSMLFYCFQCWISYNSYGQHWCVTHSRTHCPLWLTKIPCPRPFL